MPDLSNVTVDVFSDIACELGESALWDVRRNRLYWVDILRRTVYARDWSSGVTTVLGMPDLVGSVGLRSGGGLVAALRHGIAYCDIDSGAIEVMCAVETELTGNRFNDGSVDPWGRFWFGSMDIAESQPTGSFYCFHPDTTVSTAFNDIICSNGPAWSLDGTTMYHVDSTRRLIRAFDFDAIAGIVGPPRVFVNDEAESWYPDGVTVDAEGFVWNCKWNGGRVVRYAPDGSVDRVIMLPVPQPTRCAFVGPDMAMLAVTSATSGLSPAVRAAAPLSGQVLLLDPGCRGVPAPLFAG